MKGIFAAAVTPVDRDGEISHVRLAAHLRWLLHHGCHGVALFGTTGEAPSFSVAERQAALEAVLRHGLAPERLILGIGCCARADTLALARHGLDLGVERMLMLPPFYFKEVPEEGVFRAFAELIEGLGSDRLRLLLYHFPRMSMVPIARPVIERLLGRFPEIVRGIKDSSGDWDHTRELIATFPGFSVFSGSDMHLLRNLRAGGAGTISAGANLACASSRDVFDGIARGDEALAERAMKCVAAVRTVLGRHPMIPAIKHVIATGARDPVWRHVRPPLVELAAAAGETLLRDLETAGYLYDPEAYAAVSA